jgi:hypothetical protein
MSVHAGDKLSSMDKKISCAYDVDFEMNFDNRELYKSDFSTSMTIFGARLTPAVGLQHIQNDGTSHKIMAGIEMGSVSADIIIDKTVIEIDGVEDEIKCRYNDMKKQAIMERCGFNVMRITKREWELSSSACLDRIRQTINM